VADGKLSRRYQVLLSTGQCARCPKAFAGPAAVADAARHVTRTGHEVRVTQTRLIIIGPPAEVPGG
jgi:hypothetical protein